jgi:hypothetical protein
VVVKSVLRFFDKETAKMIYSDPLLGMDSPTKLFYWFSALKGQKGS